MKSMCIFLFYFFVGRKACAFAYIVWMKSSKWRHLFVYICGLVQGEVAVNRRVSTKSYMSLHALVNRVFPPLSSPPEQVCLSCFLILDLNFISVFCTLTWWWWLQEDYNTWNYWKMPVADIWGAVWAQALWRTAMSIRRRRQRGSAARYCCHNLLCSLPATE